MDQSCRDCRVETREGRRVATVKDGADAVSLPLCSVATEDASFLCANHESANGENTPSWVPDRSAANTLEGLLLAPLRTMNISTWPCRRTPCRAYSRVILQANGSQSFIRALVLKQKLIRGLRQMPQVPPQDTAICGDGHCLSSPFRLHPSKVIHRVPAKRSISFCPIELLLCALAIPVALSGSTHTVVRSGSQRCIVT